MPAPQRNKPSVKEPLSTPERIRRHFKSLVAQIDGGHLKNAIKTCDKILLLEPNDPDALQTKLSLLLHTDQYAPAFALSQILQKDQESTFPIVFGQAYALYRLNREPEAADVVHTIQTEGEHEERGVMHMEAQIEYRRGNYQKAQNLYSQIFDSAPPHSDEQSDSLTNLTASQTHLDFLQTGFLRSLHSLSPSVINSLEDAPPPPVISSHPIITIAPTQQEAPAPAKKVRMARVPKGVVPGVTPPPDPERWLKKSERTSTHHGGKRRKGGASGGATQGSLVEGGTKGNTGKTKKKK